MGEVLAFPRKPDDSVALINAEIDWYLAMLRQGYHPDEAIRALARAQRDFDQRFWWRPGQTLPERAPKLVETK